MQPRDDLAVMSPTPIYGKKLENTSTIETNNNAKIQYHSTIREYQMSSNMWWQPSFIDQSQKDNRVTHLPQRLDLWSSLILPFVFINVWTPKQNRTTHHLVQVSEAHWPETRIFVLLIIWKFWRCSLGSLVPVKSSLDFLPLGPILDPLFLSLGVFQGFHQGLQMSWSVWLLGKEHRLNPIKI